MPTVVYAVASTRDRPVSVRLVDEAPDGVAPDAVAVHRDYDAAPWQVREDGTLAYDRELAPCATRRTALVLDVRDAVAARLLDAPRIEAVRREDVRPSV